MKIIGKQGRDTFIAIVTKVELEKVSDKCYGKLGEVDVGDDYPIGEGYDFRGDIQSACSKMESAMQAFGAAQDTLRRFAVMVSQLPPKEAA